MTTRTKMDEITERLAHAALQEGIADALYSSINSPIGTLLIAQTEKGLCRVAFQEEAEDEVLYELARGVGPRLLSSREHTKIVRDALEEYFEGGIKDLSLPVDLTMVRSDFRRKVLQRLRRVPGGRVTTYGALAGSVGAPRAARAVGTACATNPVPIVVPCHRVVPAGGGLGNYGGGVETKRWLLEFEGALSE